MELLRAEVPAGLSGTPWSCRLLPTADSFRKRGRISQRRGGAASLPVVPGVGSEQEALGESLDVTPARLRHPKACALHGVHADTGHPILIPEVPAFAPDLHPGPGTF